MVLRFTLWARTCHEVSSGRLVDIYARPFPSESLKVAITTHKALLPHDST